MERKQKVIIWGYPLYSHTHSYIHEAFYKTFKFLGFPTYWFHDLDFPIDFNYENCLFITEGFADKNIPLKKTSTYLVMYTPSPEKYQDVKSFYEMRLIAKNFKDHISEYNFDANKAEKLSENFYLSKEHDTKKCIDRETQTNFEFKWKSVYFNWATNLLPEEFNFNSIYNRREKAINYVGTISKKGLTENYSNIKPFVKALRKKGISFYHFNPWKNPISSDYARVLIERSLLAPDIRGIQHLKQGLVTCRVLKNISYGQLGLTNSYAIYEAMAGNLVYSPDPIDLLQQGLKNRFNYKLIEEGMRFCRANHTYVNRCNDILKLI